MKSLFKVGNRVGLKSDIKYLEVSNIENIYAIKFGTIISTDFIANNKVKVKWDQECTDYSKTDKSGNYLIYSEREYNVDEILLEKDINNKIKTLEEKYKKISTHITSLLQNAGNAIAEANRIADGKLKDFHDLLDPLISSLDNVGWNTSSFQC